MNQPDQKSPFREWIKENLGKWIEAIRYFSERRLFLENPAMAIREHPEGIKSRPLSFAMQGMLIIVLVFSGGDWIIKYFTDLPEPMTVRLWQALPKFMADVDVPPTECLAQTIRRAADGKITRNEFGYLQRSQEIANSLGPILQSLGIVIAAALFRLFVGIWKSRYPLAARAHRAYLYYVTSILFLPNAFNGFIVYVIATISRLFPVPTPDAPGFSEPAAYKIAFASIFALSILRYGVRVWAVYRLWACSPRLDDMLRGNKPFRAHPVRRRFPVFFSLLAAIVAAKFIMNLLEFPIQIFYILVRFMIAELNSEVVCFFG